MRNVPLDEGINDFLFASIKRNVEKIKVEGQADEEVLCYLACDAMVLTRNVVYTVQNVGQFDENCEFKKHVMLFMIREISNKWKAPIAYYFNGAGGMLSAKIEELVPNLIRHLKAYGITIVGTIAD